MTKLDTKPEVTQEEKNAWLPFVRIGSRIEDCCVAFPAPVGYFSGELIKEKTSAPRKAIQKVLKTKKK